MRLKGKGSLDLTPHLLLAYRFFSDDGIVWNCRLSEEVLDEMMTWPHQRRANPEKLENMFATQPITTRAVISSPYHVKATYIHRDANVTVDELIEAVFAEIFERNGFSTYLSVRGYVKGAFSDERTPNLGQASPLTGQYSEFDSASITVLTTYKLVERILTHSDLKADELAHLARVCHLWKAVIFQPITLRSRLFLVPEHDPRTLIRMHPTDYSVRGWLVHPLLSNARFRRYQSSTHFTVTFAMYLRILKLCSKRRRWRALIIHLFRKLSYIRSTSAAAFTITGKRCTNRRVSAFWTFSTR